MIYLLKSEINIPNKLWKEKKLKRRRFSCSKTQQTTLIEYQSLYVWSCYTMTIPQTPAAGASSSKYKVFLSFGDDTSKSFSDHLYKSMVRKGIDTFWAYKKIEKGETIDTNRLKAIEESRFAVVVFSREYLSSAEGLDELVKIAEMKLERVYPVFYGVEPSEVRKQNEIFGDAFDLAETEKVEKVNKWRNVLTEMATIAGWDLKNE